MEYTPEQISKALDLIKAVIDEEGPFDGFLGFSQGASLILSYLMQHEMDHPHKTPDFQFAILFSPFTAVSSSSTLYDEIISLFGQQELKIFKELMSSYRHSAEPIVTNTDSCNDWRVKALIDNVLPTLQVGFVYEFISPDQFLSILATGDASVIPRVLVPALIKERIRIPVVHVIGAKDETLFKAQAECMKGLCTPGLLHCMKHSLGHDIPRGVEANSIVREIEWAMDASRRNRL